MRRPVATLEDALRVADHASDDALAAIASSGAGSRDADRAVALGILANHVDGPSPPLRTIADVDAVCVRHGLVRDPQDESEPGVAWSVPGVRVCASTSIGWGVTRISVDWVRTATAGQWSEVQNIQLAELYHSSTAAMLDATIRAALAAQGVTG